MFLTWGEAVERVLMQWNDDAFIRTISAVLPEMPAKRSCHCWGLNYNLCWAAAINLKMDEKFFWYTNISSIWPLIANWNPELLLKGELLTFVPKTKDLKTYHTHKQCLKILVQTMEIALLFSRWQTEQQHKYKWLLRGQAASPWRFWKRSPDFPPPPIHSNLPLQLVCQTLS